MFSLIVVLFVAAICLFLAETLVPGWVLGIFGFMVLATALVLTFIQYGVAVGALAVCVTTVCVIAGFGVWMRVFPESALGKKLTNQSVAGGKHGTITTQFSPGQEGIAETDLRPAGTGRFGNQRVDVVSEATFISRNEKICITQIAGSRVVVRPLGTFEG